MMKESKKSCFPPFYDKCLDQQDYYIGPYTYTAKCIKITAVQSLQSKKMVPTHGGLQGNMAIQYMDNANPFAIHNPQRAELQ